MPYIFLLLFLHLFFIYAFLPPTLGGLQMELGQTFHMLWREPDLQFGAQKLPVLDVYFDTLTT